MKQEKQGRGARGVNVSWRGNCRNGEIGGSRDAAGTKTLESAVTTGDNPQWLWQSSASLRERGEG